MFPPLIIIEPFGSHMIVAFLYSIYYCPGGRDIPSPLDISKLSAFTRRGVIHHPLINKGPFLNYVPGSRDIPFEKGCMNLPFPVHLRCINEVQLRQGRSDHLRGTLQVPVR